MEVVIPNGTQVHITIGQPPLLALPYDKRAVAIPSEGPRGRIAKGLLAGFVLVGAFQAGRFLPHRAETASAAQLAAGRSGTGATESGGGNGEIPTAFRAQMGQPPQVVPPPGAAPAGTAGGSTGNAAAPAAAPASANPFGLQG